MVIFYKNNHMLESKGQTDVLAINARVRYDVSQRGYRKLHGQLGVLGK